MIICSLRSRTLVVQTQLEATEVERDDVMDHARIMAHDFQENAACTCVIS